MPSIFAKQMRSIINAVCEAMNFTWAEYATVLGAKEADLQDLVNDRKFPSPRKFRSIHDTVYRYNRMGKACELMNALLTKDLDGITPLANQIEGFRKPGDCITLNDYLVLPVFDGVLGVLRCLDREQMEAVLLEAANDSRELRYTVHS